MWFSSSFRVKQLLAMQPSCCNKNCMFIRSNYRVFPTKNFMSDPARAKTETSISKT